MLEDQQGDMNQEDESRMKKKVAKSAWNVAKDKASMHMNIEKVQVRGGGNPQARIPSPAGEQLRTAELREA